MNEKIKLIDKDTDLSNVKPFPWDVDINGRPFYVARIEGFIHSIGGRYGTNEYWCWPREERPTYANMIQFNGPCCRWGAIFSDNNYIRHKYGTQVCNNCRATITRNEEGFYTFICADLKSAAAKAQVLIDEFNQHPVNLNEIEFDKKLIGRKVWWRDSPGIIRSYIKGQACVMIEPDGIDAFPKPAFFNDDDLLCGEEGDIKTEIIDKNIWWFR